MKSTNVLLAIDLGMGALKYKGEKDEGQQEAHAAMKMGDAHDDVFGEGAKAPLVEFGNDSLYVGPYAHLKGERIGNRGDDRLTEGNEIKALFYSVLSRYMSKAKLKGSKPFDIIVGLPFRMLTTENKAITYDAVSEWMAGEHEWSVDGVEWKSNVDNITLLPQAAGAMLNYVYDDKGNMVPERVAVMRQKTGFISIGHNTGELLGMEGSNQIETMTASVDVGVRFLIDILENMEGVNLSREGIDIELRLPAPQRSIQSQIEIAVPQWWQKVKASINQEWKNQWKSATHIFGAGGGVEILNGELRSYFSGRLMQDEDPVFSIVRGLYKAGLANGKKK